MKRKHFRRLGAWFLSLALCLSLLPTAAFAAGGDTGKAIQFVDRGTAANISGGQGSNIYFGTYQQSSNGSGGYNTDPIKWRVLENANGQLFLLSDQNLDVFQYHTDDEAVTWATSTMRSWLNGYGAAQNTGGDSGIDYTDDNFIGTAFSAKEQGAIAATTVVNDDNPDYYIEGGENTTDKIFLLSIAEAQNSSYFADNNSRKGTNTAYVADGGKIDGSMYGVGAADFWWLRSPGGNASNAASVGSSGGVITGGDNADYGSIAVRPAFNLDLTSVLFTSAAAGGKPDGGLQAVEDYTGNEWKLTLKDESRNFAVSNAATNGENTIGFFYSDAQAGENEYISAVIEDSGTITHYGRILQLDGATNGASGIARLTLPEGVTLSDTTKLYVFNEQYNGGENDDTKLTDYASQLIEISNPVADTTAPTLTPGSATRDSETAATVKFTSSEAGSYYYAIVESDASEPEIDTTGTGAVCAVGENTISLDNLTAGAKDIYIVAKDAAGNVSGKLKIAIPAYIKPSYGISASPAALNFGSKTVGYTEAPAAQTVTLTNTGNQAITVTLPTSTNYAITAGEGFANGTATLAPNGTAAFTVQPNTGLDVDDYSETLTVSGSNDTSAQVALSFSVVEAAPDTYTLTVNLNGGSGSTTGGEYAEGAVVNINAGSRSNYRFDGWTSSNGGSFADASSASTTFTMPAADTTITANWRYVGGPSQPSKPTGPSTGDSNGWEDIQEEIGEAKPGDTIIVDMNGETEVPGDVFEDIAGEDVNIKFELDNGVSWEVNGQDVPKDTDFKDLDLGVSMGTSGISVDVINAVTGELGAVQVTLAHDGEFGFALTLTAPLGAENAGYWANLYHHNEKANTLNYETSGQIAKDGSVSLRLTHASQYAIVIDDKSHDLPFTDVPEAWYTPAVEYAYIHGLMEGTSGTTFAPNKQLTRAEAAQILYNLEGQPETAGESAFTDVKAGQWYETAILWAEQTGVVDGYGDGTFKPDKVVTREEFAQMMYNYAVFKKLDTTAQADLSQFPDGEQVSVWAESAMSWANGNGLINGHDDGRLDPQGTTLRSQAASILMNFDLNLVK